MSSAEGAEVETVGFPINAVVGVAVVGDNVGTVGGAKASGEKESTQFGSLLATSRKRC